MSSVTNDIGRLSDFSPRRLFGRLRPAASRSAVISVALFSLFSPDLANPAQAAVGDYAGSLSTSLQRSSPVEEIQYYSLNDSNYCWYNGGWQGPGWYTCGYEWDDGLGWGGPYGWNGWGGGRRIRLHGSHGIGVWHSHPATHVFGGGAPVSSGLSGGVAPASPGFAESGAHVFHGISGGAPGFHGVSGGAPSLPRFVGGSPGFHGFGGVAPASPGFASGGAPAFRGFVGGAPGLQGFGGGASAFHGFAGGGGFHGGGAFAFGGHGGGGHR
jgi:hypothetical protein